MLNNNLKQCREELEMTQTELGYIFGVQKATISNWENGYDIIPFNKLLRFCNLYDFSLDLKISQQTIADECAISRACYSHYELGMSLVSTMTIYTICKKHNMSMDKLLKRKPKEKHQ